MRDNSTNAIEIQDKVNQIFVDLFDLTPETITDELTADDVALWDSLNHLKLVTVLEQEFDIKFSMAEISSMESVSQVRALLRQKIETWS